METVTVRAALEDGTEYKFTFFRSGSFSAKASSLLSITEAAATSRGVAPRMDGEATGQRHKTIRRPYIGQDDDLNTFPMLLQPKDLTLCKEEVFYVQDHVLAKGRGVRNNNIYINLVQHAGLQYKFT